MDKVAFGLFLRRSLLAIESAWSCSHAGHPRRDGRRPRRQWYWNCRNESFP